MTGPVLVTSDGVAPDHANLRAVDLIQPFVPEGVFDAQGSSGLSANAPAAALHGLAVGYQQFALRVATFNVLSLGKPKDARPDVEVTQGLAYQPARAALLACPRHSGSFPAGNPSRPWYHQDWKTP